MCAREHTWGMSSMVRPTCGCSQEAHVDRLQGVHAFNPQHRWSKGMLCAYSRG